MHDFDAPNRPVFCGGQFESKVVKMTNGNYRCNLHNSQIDYLTFKLTADKNFDLGLEMKRLFFVKILFDSIYDMTALII